MRSELIRVGQIEIRFLLESADTQGALAMFEFTVPAGAKVPLPHSHKNYDETLHGIQGVITFTIEGKPHEIGPGQACFVPRGAVHGFNNLTPTATKTLAIITPGLLGPDFFREMAAIVNPGGKPDLERMKAIMLKHGLVPAIP